MKLDEIKEIAKRHGISPGRMKKAELVRTIQQLEKNDPCFDTGNSSTCKQDTCLWKEDCR